MIKEILKANHNKFALKENSMNFNAPIHFESQLKAEFLHVFLLNFMYLYVHGISC